MLYNMEYKIINIALIEYFNKSIRASNYLKEKTVLNNILVQHCLTWRKILNVKLFNILVY